MSLFDIIFKDAPPDTLVEVGPIGHTQFWAPAKLLSIGEWPQDQDIYFGPALRDTSERGTKEAVSATRTLWVDVDLDDKARVPDYNDRRISVLTPLALLPPSIVVWSGWGYHLYWVLDGWLADVARLEEANKVLRDDIKADHTWNANRLLRVPGTTNHRHGQPLVCRIIQANPFTYSIEDVLAVGEVSSATRHKISTGDRRGYRSRSERDFAVLRELGQLDLSDTAIENIFQYHKVGDRYQDPEKGGRAYLDRTLERARNIGPRPGSAGRGRGHEPAELDKRDDGYYLVRGKSSRRLSTFTLDPKLLLEGDDHDALLCDVHASDYTWTNITFTRNAFTGRNALDKEARLASWQWLGKDDDVRSLLPFLMAQLEEVGLPRVRASSTLGLHQLGPNRYAYLAIDSLLSVHGVQGKTTAPLVYLPTGRESPNVHYTDTADPLTMEQRTTIGTLLSGINMADVIWPCIGWYFASPFKPALEQLTPSVRFPILNVFGTRGSGKTTTIQRVMLPLLGVTDPKSYDAKTSAFVTLALLGGTNTTPIAFSEFRQGSVEAFIRYILLSYDTGHIPKGRADQTTLDYPLSAPFSIDGEDQVDDAAAKERIIAINFRPDTISEESAAWRNFNQLILRNDSFNSFATLYLQHCLQILERGSLHTQFESARQMMLNAFPSTLPDRIRNNLSVSWLGIVTFCEFCGLTIPPAQVLAGSLALVFNQKMGRTLTLADEFMTDLLNHLASHRSSLPWMADEEGVWFQLTPAYNWWLGSRKRAGLGALGRDAVRIQLTECGYVGTPAQRSGLWMYPINVKAASAAGLDVPLHYERRILEGVEY